MALTQADLDRLEAQNKAVQKELFDIVTKTGVSAEQRAIDNARIKVLNKQAADIVAQQRSAQINTKETPFNPVTSKPVTTNTPPPPGYTQQQLDAVTGYKKKIADIDAALNKRAPGTDAEKLLATKAQYELEIDRIALGQNTASPVSTGPETTPVVIPKTEYTTDPATGQRYRVADSGGPALSGVPLVGDESPDRLSPRRATRIDGPPLPNDLHQYPSYTYGISLHLLSAQQYNNIVNNPGEYIPENVLIASAGRYDNKTFPRNKFFNEDFYFEDLELTTVIATNARSRNTNAIEVKFTVIEPYGFTLVERIMKAASDLRSNNYLDMPYLLEIDFFAHNDAGEIVGKLSNITKRIPIKLAKMDIKAGVKGAEYSIQAYPFGHSAFDVTTVSTPDAIEVVAGSLTEFFASDIATVIDAANRETITDPDTGIIYRTAPEGAPKLGMVKNIKASTRTSYAGAINTYQKDLVSKNQQGVADTYSFSFDPEILKNQKFRTNTKNIRSHKTNKMSKLDNTSSIRNSMLSGVASSDFDEDQKIFQIEGGTTVDQVINYVMRQTNYIQQQVLVPEEFSSQEAYDEEFKAREEQPLYWFKIVPTVILGEWDLVRRKWGRKINYHIQRHIIKNVRAKSAPQGTVNSPVKKYEYLYTGKNNDILDWDLQFNVLYYNAMTVYKNSQAILGVGGSNTTGRITEENAASAPKFNNTTDLSIKNPNAVATSVNVPVVLNSPSTTGSATVTVRDQAVADLDYSLSRMDGADQLEVKLKIIGDPAYIKQDDIFYPPASFDSVVEPDPGTDIRLTPNNSLRTDFSELYVQLIFRTPRDIDESTGLMQFEEGKSVSVFSGMYLVLKVINSFRQGVFTQELSLVRLPRQPKYDYTEVTAPKTDERSEVDGNITPEPPVDNDDATTLPPPADDPEDGKAGVDTVDAADPAVDPEQENLADIAATSPTQTITDQTEPLTTVPLQEKLSFNETFRRARAANGGRPGGLFEWNGKQYQTNIVGEEYIGNPIPVTFNKF